MSRNSPIDAPESRASVEEAGPGSVMLVIATEKEAPQLKAFSVLAPLQGVKAPALFAAYGPDHRPWIALKLENGAQLPSAIAELKRIGKIDPRNPVRKLSL